MNLFPNRLGLIQHIVLSYHDLTVWRTAWNPGAFMVEVNSRNLSG
jgi:hypothetical protein